MCRPITNRYFCKKCHRFYVVTFGDCIAFHIDYRCPYCKSDDFDIVPDNMSRLEYLWNIIRDKTIKK